MGNSQKIKMNKGRDHYFSERYDTKERFVSYWHQINEIIKLKPNKVLEVGIGNGFVSEYLKKKGLNVVTLDIDHELGPNIAGSILSMPFVSNSFDVAICCQVLEHLPYGEFARALRELHRISQKYIVLSLPDHTPVYRLNLELPRIKPIKKLIPHPFPRPTHHEYDGEHYWIIGKSKYPLKRIESDIIRAGFKIIKSYRVFEFYGHRFLIIEKS